MYSLTSETSNVLLLAQWSPRSTLFIPSIGFAIRVISTCPALPLIHECASFPEIFPRRARIVADAQAFQESFEIDAVVTSHFNRPASALVCRAAVSTLLKISAGSTHSLSIVSIT